MSASESLDPRLTPARRDLAASYLQGRVVAARFTPGTPRVIVAEAANLRRHPRPDAPVETQALHGETVTLYDESEGWGWVQLAADGYTGYIAMHELGFDMSRATHVVAVNRTFVYPAADLKQPIMSALPLGARVAISEAGTPFARLAAGGFVFMAHLAAVGVHESDFVTIAERLCFSPYLWGGKTSQGIDCSGLVQLALSRAGQAVPRDTDLQQNTVGTAIPVQPELGGLRRGDLVFWRGHVGIMCDNTHLLHANAHHMAVAREPLAIAAARISQSSQASVSAIKRPILGQG